MADNNESFVIEDDFDPLADIDLEEFDQDGDADYMAPIPDADKSVVPPKVELPPEQRIEKLIAGMPGQAHRLLAAVDACREPQTLEEAAKRVDAAYPQGASVFEATQIVLLMERAGALEKIKPEAETDAETEQAVDETADVQDAAAAPRTQADENDPGYVGVTPAAPATYVATPAGLAAYEARTGAKVVLDLVAETPQYIPIYQRILKMCNAEGGSTVAPLNKAVDSDPLVQEPRLFCTHFLNKLECAGGLVWRDAWHITQAGRDALASDLFVK